MANKCILGAKASVSIPNEKWGFLRESSDSKDISNKDPLTGLHRTGLDKFWE